MISLNIILCQYPWFCSYFLHDLWELWTCIGIHQICMAPIIANHEWIFIMVFNIPMLSRMDVNWSRRVAKDELLDTGFLQVVPPPCWLINEILGFLVLQPFILVPASTTFSHHRCSSHLLFLRWILSDSASYLSHLLFALSHLVFSWCTISPHVVFFFVFAEDWCLAKLPVWCMY